MQDRISAYPGRVKLTPVAGQADTYDLTRADQPTQEGTPLNKAALLSDTTVSSWQSGYPWDKEAAAVTPDDVLARIAYLRGQAGGIATLDATGKLMYDQIPDISNTLDIEGGKGPSGSSPEMAILFVANNSSTAASARIDNFLNGSGSYLVQVPAYQCVPVLIAGGSFKLTTTATSTNHQYHSDSIVLNGSVSSGAANYYIHSAGTFVIYGIYCLTGDTRITMADRSTKRMDEIEVGDELLSYDWETMRLVPNRVVYTDRDEQKTHIRYDKWIFEDGTVVKTVHRHEFYCVEACRMKYMDEWRIGEHAYTLDGRRVALVSHETVEEAVRHYKLTGQKGTNYFANGLLTGARNCPTGIEL